MKIYFLRHGETAWNQLGKIQGRIDNPLNEQGVKQSQTAQKLFASIPFTHAYASTLLRAFETAQIIIDKRPLVIKQDARLVERDFGELEGTAHEMYYLYEEKGTIPASVETRESIHQRVHAFFQEMVEQHQADDVILVSAHAHAIRAWAEKMFPEDFPFSTRLHNCQAIITDFNDGQFSFCGVTDKIKTED